VSLFDFLISHFKHEVESSFIVKNVESVLNTLVLYEKGLKRLLGACCCVSSREFDLCVGLENFSTFQFIASAMRGRRVEGGRVEFEKPFVKPAENLPTQ
jgi:hypothetical protein